jgi:hypothetical protein
MSEVYRFMGASHIVYRKRELRGQMRENLPVTVRRGARLVIQ